MRTAGIAEKSAFANALVEQPPVMVLMTACCARNKMAGPKKPATDEYKVAALRLLWVVAFRKFAFSVVGFQSAAPRRLQFFKESVDRCGAMSLWREQRHLPRAGTQHSDFFY